MQPTNINPLSDPCFNTGAAPCDYQIYWNTHAHGTRRVLTKMRQCGADWSFSLEALSDALVTGRNQIFLGCGDGHSQVNRHYIHARLLKAGPKLQKHVLRMTDHYLELANGACIHFIDPGSHCAALSGNVYASEYAWADSPSRVIALAKSMSMHAGHHATFYTTPSRSLEAWREYKKLRAGINAANLIFTAEDAAASDSPLFNDDWLEQMKLESSAENWKMLFMCEWPQTDREQSA